DGGLPGQAATLALHDRLRGWRVRGWAGRGHRRAPGRHPARHGLRHHHPGLRHRDRGRLRQPARDRPGRLHHRRGVFLRHLAHAGYRAVLALHHHGGRAHRAPVGAPGPLRRGRAVKRWVLIVVGVVALVLPYVTEPIVVHTAIEILIMALFAMSFNLL